MESLHGTASYRPSRGRSVSASEQPVEKGRQGAAVEADAREALRRPGVQLRRSPLRVCEPRDGRIGRFGPRPIVARRLAEHVRIALDVEYVVEDLEGEPDVVARSS